MARDPRKKKRRNPLVRLSLTVFFLIIIGFFIFYIIDNPGLLDNIMDREQEDSPEIAPMEAREDDSGQSAVSAGDEQPAGEGDSLWQRITAFFRQKSGSPEDIQEYPSRLTLEIYFAGTGPEEVLVSEERTVIAGNPGNALKGAMEELLKGPRQSYHFPVIPAGTRLLGSRYVDGVAEVDLSREFLDNALDTRILDEYIIYSIVNTLTGIPEVDGVIFFMEGKRIKTYGNIDLSIPLIRNQDLIIEDEQ